MKKDLPCKGVTLISGSASLENVRLNSRKPLKTDKTTNKAKEPMMIPLKAMREIIVIALFLLLLKIYRFAMYSGKFTYDFLRFSNRSRFSIGFSFLERALSIFSM